MEKKQSRLSKKWTKKCPESQLLRSARQRAKQKGMECTITQNDIHIPELCPVFKVPLVKRTEYAPSLDRIDNTKGYIPENIVVVSRKANIMKNNGSVEDLRMLVEYYSKLS